MAVDQLDQLESALRKIGFYIAMAVIVVGVVVGLKLRTTDNSVGGLGVSNKVQIQTWPKSVPAYAETDAKRWMAKAVPLVEKATHRKFKVMPKCAIISRADYAKLLYDMSLPNCRIVQPFEAEYRASESSEVGASQDLGTYLPKQNTIYLIEENFFEQTEGVAKYRVDDFMTLVVAHELARCIVGQQVDWLQKTAQCENESELEAVTAVLEGYPMLVHKQVAVMLGLKVADEQFDKLYFLEEQILDHNPESQVILKHENVYAIGLRFAEWQYKHGGVEQLWKAMELPPKDLRIVRNPARYARWRVSSMSRPDYDFAAVLHGMESRFGASKWHIANRKMDGDGTCRGYTSSDAQRIQSVANATIQSQTLAAIEGKKEACIWLCWMSDKAAVRLMLDLDLQEISLALESINRRDAGSGLCPKPTPLPGVRADIAEKIRYRCKWPDGYRTTTHILIGRGKILVGVVFTEIELSDAKAISIAEEVFKKLPKQLTASK